MEDQKILLESFDTEMIIESVVDNEKNDRWLIKGILLTETVSSNGIEYDKSAVDNIYKTGTELLKNGGVPVLTDHKRFTENTVGKLTTLKRNIDNVYFDGFVLKGLDPNLDKRLEAGLITKVSIGYVFESLKCSICGSDLFSCDHVPRRKYNGKTANPIPVNPSLRELSLVPVPGIIGTSLSVESFLKRSFINKEEEIENSERIMTDNKELVNSLKEQIETLQAEKSALEKTITSRDEKITQLEDSLKSYHEKAKNSLIDEILAIEKSNGITQDINERSEELKEMSNGQLEAIYMVNKRYDGKSIQKETTPEFTQTPKPFKTESDKKYGNLYKDIEGYEK